MNTTDPDNLLPPPIGDCPICGEPLTEDTNVVWRDHGGWAHESCTTNPPAPPARPEKEAD